MAVVDCVVVVVACEVVVDCDVVDVVEDPRLDGGGDGTAEDEIEVLVLVPDCEIVGVIDETPLLSVVDAVTDVIEVLSSVLEVLEDDIVDVTLFFAAIIPLS